MDIYLHLAFWNVRHENGAKKLQTKNTNSNNQTPIHSFQRKFYNPTKSLPMQIEWKQRNKNGIFKWKRLNDDDCDDDDSNEDDGVLCLRFINFAAWVCVARN